MEMTAKDWGNLLLILFFICFIALLVHDVMTNQPSSRNRNVKYRSDKHGKE